MSEHRQLIEAVCRMVEHVVQLSLPETHRGLRARKVLKPLVEPAVLDALNATISGLTAKLVEELKVPVPPTEGVSGRCTVLDNREPCDRCGQVTLVAVHTLVAGKTQVVECEEHAPEFKRRRT